MKAFAYSAAIAYRVGLIHSRLGFVENGIKSFSNL